MVWIDTAGNYHYEVAEWGSDTFIAPQDYNWTVLWAKFQELEKLVEERGREIQKLEAQIVELKKHIEVLERDSTSPS